MMIARCNPVLVPIIADHCREDKNAPGGLCQLGNPGISVDVSGGRCGQEYLGLRLRRRLISWKGEDELMLIQTS